MMSIYPRLRVYENGTGKVTIQIKMSERSSWRRATKKELCDYYDSPIEATPAKGVRLKC